LARDKLKAPELKQFGELDAEDFQRHPVWIGCHTADYGKPWYDDTDEETFRPYAEKLPADPSEGMLLVRAAISLNDGSTYPGFMTPGSGLGAQQLQIFVDDRVFGFWGGMVGIAERAQQELYATLGKDPEAIFPLRFVADPGLTTGIVEGQVDGFYRKSRDGIHVSFVGDRGKRADAGSPGATWFQMSARSVRGYPQPEREFQYMKIVYGEPCFRCRIFERQIAPFRFKKSVSMPSGFTQLNWVHDVFFVPPAILEEIIKAGITGVSPGPAVYHRSGLECIDRMQLLIPAVIACAEISQLPTVTCRPENEEVVAMRAKYGTSEERMSSLSPELQEKILKQRERIAAIPYCGKVKYHPPTSLALIADRLIGAPDLFQTAEWFGSGGLAFRLTLASQRFANLVRERRWKGLDFHSARQNGWSERVI
jgi:hypothetical protein